MPKSPTNHVENKYDFCCKAIKCFCDRKPVDYYYFIYRALSAKSKNHIYALALIYCIRNEYSISDRTVARAFRKKPEKVKYLYQDARNKFKYNDFNFLLALSEIRDICFEAKPTLNF